MWIYKNFQEIKFDDPIPENIRPVANDNTNDNTNENFDIPTNFEEILYEIVDKKQFHFS